MSALVERIIAARDRLKYLRGQGEDYIWRPAKEAVDALADAANAITERDETIFYLRQKMEALSAATASPECFGVPQDAPILTSNGHSDAEPSGPCPNCGSNLHGVS